MSVSTVEAGAAPGPSPARSRPVSRGRSDLGRAIGLLALLAVVVVARWLAIRDGSAGPIVVGAGFGLALAAIAVLGRSTPLRVQSTGRGTARSIVIGIVGGGALVALALAGRTIGGAPAVLPPVRGDLFAPWAIATIVVASGEEAVLRGVVFARLLRGAGIWPAILVTSLAFALMHVPFYGWRVVPLDLGVGIWFAGLRLWSGGIVAPSISHALADLATWWL